MCACSTNMQREKKLVTNSPTYNHVKCPNQKTQKKIKLRKLKIIHFCHYIRSSLVRWSMYNFHFRIFLKSIFLYLQEKKTVVDIVFIIVLLPSILAQSQFALCSAVCNHGKLINAARRNKKHITVCLKKVTNKSILIEFS